jgi:hypothetical protein
MSINHPIINNNNIIPLILSIFSTCAAIYESTCSTAPNQDEGHSGEQKGILVQIKRSHEWEVLGKKVISFYLGNTQITETLPENT